MKLIASIAALVCGILPVMVMANPVVDFVFPAAHATVPEPGTLALLAMGAAAAGATGYARKRKK